MSKRFATGSFIVAITGGSGAGKTTVADALSAALAPLPVTILREDDYYRDNAATPGFDAARFNFDHIDTRDHALLADHLAALKAGRSIEMPRYDFVTHSRRPDREQVQPAAVVLVEGTQVLHPPALRALYDLALYLDVPDDIRLIRRVQRDVAERGRSVDAVAGQYLKTVRPMHYRFTHPARLHAQVIAFDDAMLAADKEAQMETLREVVGAVAQKVRETLTPPAI